MIDKKLRVYTHIIEKIKLAKRIALVSHKNPDVDTIGCSTAFYEIIKNNFLYKNIDLICVDEIPKKYRFLPHSEKFKQNFHPSNYDLIIFFDSGSKTQTGFDELFPALFDGKTYNTLSIDHHPTNEFYAKQNILNTTYSSTTMIVFEIFSMLGISISKAAATSLIAGLYTDTGGFKHGNVNAVTYLVASKLLELGAQKELVIEKFFRHNKLSTIRLWGKIISDSFIDEENILFSYVNKTSLDSYDSDYEDISGVIDYLNMAEGIKYSTLLTQK